MRALFAPWTDRSLIDQGKQGLTQPRWFFVQKVGRRERPLRRSRGAVQWARGQLARKFERMLVARGGEVRIHEIHSEKHEARAGAGRARLRVLPGVHLGDAVGRVCAVSDRAGGSGLFHARVFRAKRDPASLACGFRLGRLLLAEGSAVAFSDTGAGAFSCGFAAGCLAAWRRGFVRVVACRGGRVLRMGKRDHVRRLAGNRGCAKGVHGRYRRVCRRWDFGVAVFRC